MAPLKNIYSIYILWWRNSSKLPKVLIENLTVHVSNFNLEFQVLNLYFIILSFYLPQVDFKNKVF